MKMPNIIFEKMTLKDNIDTIKWQYFDNDDSLNIGGYVLKYFPELKNIKNDTPLDEVYKKIEEVVTKEYYQKEDIINDRVNHYNEIWKEYNDKYLSLLLDYFNIKWPSNIKEIKATVGLLPVYPRNLYKFSFMVDICLEDEMLIDVTAHEVLHFAWFIKWKIMYPDIDRREYDSPYLPWQYSEMVTDPILNNKPFNNLFGFNEKGYDSFYELYDGDTLVMDNLRNIYGNDLSIEDKINKGYEYIKTYFNKKE